MEKEERITYLKFRIEEMRKELMSLLGINNIKLCEIATFDFEDQIYVVRYLPERVLDKTEFCWIIEGSCSDEQNANHFIDELLDLDPESLDYLYYGRKIEATINDNGDVICTNNNLK